MAGGMRGEEEGGLDDEGREMRAAGLIYIQATNKIPHMR